MQRDPDYLQALRRIVAMLRTEFPICQYHPEGGAPAQGSIRGGSFISGAVFSAGPLGLGRTLFLERGEIAACVSAITPAVQRKIDEFVSSVKSFRLTWISQRGSVQIDCGRFASSHEARSAIPGAKARLQAQYPASSDEHYPHDINAGTWAVAPVEHEHPIRHSPDAPTLVSVRVETAWSIDFGKLYYAWAKEQLGPNAGIIYPAKRSDINADVYCNFDVSFLDVLREHDVPFEEL